jgi:hypothetical protein
VSEGTSSAGIGSQSAACMDPCLGRGYSTSKCDRALELDTCEAPGSWSRYFGRNAVPARTRTLRICSSGASSSSAEDKAGTLAV